MRAKDLINSAIPSLKLTDCVAKAMDWMTELQVHSLPIVDRNKFLGFFVKTVVLDHATYAKKISHLNIINERHYVDQEVHFYELVKATFEHEANIIAVLDKQINYIGAVTTLDIVAAFSKMAMITAPGTIIVLNMTLQDYSLAEISRVVESERGKILSSCINTQDKQHQKITLTLKLNLEQCPAIISTLKRLGYHIDYVSSKGGEAYFEKERLDTLLRYLNI